MAMLTEPDWSRDANRVPIDPMMRYCRRETPLPTAKLNKLPKKAPSTTVERQRGEQQEEYGGSQRPMTVPSTLESSGPLIVGNVDCQSEELVIYAAGSAISLIKEAGAYSIGDALVALGASA